MSAVIFVKKMCLICINLDTNTIRYKNLLAIKYKSVLLCGPYFPLRGIGGHHQYTVVITTVYWWS